jgi:hypothetical protein
MRAGIPGLWVDGREARNDLGTVLARIADHPARRITELLAWNMPSFLRVRSSQAETASDKSGKL